MKKVLGKRTGSSPKKKPAATGSELWGSLSIRDFYFTESGILQPLPVKWTDTNSGTIASRTQGRES
jgi:hypothetical protein